MDQHTLSPREPVRGKRQRPRPDTAAIPHIYPSPCGKEWNGVRDMYDGLLLLIQRLRAPANEAALASNHTACAGWNERGVEGSRLRTRRGGDRRMRGGFLSPPRDQLTTTTLDAPVDPPHDRIAVKHSTLRRDQGRHPPKARENLRDPTTRSTFSCRGSTLRSTWAHGVTLPPPEDRR